MSNNKVISFKMLDESNTPMTFKMNRIDPIRKAIDAYCHRTNKQIGISRYLFNEKPIDITSIKETPESLGMKEGDSIDVIHILYRINKRRESSEEEILEPSAKKLSSKINFKLEDDNGCTMSFKMNKKDPIKKAIKVYCERTNTSVHLLRFYYDNNLINRYDILDTPESLQMKEGDVIIVQPYSDAGN